MRSTLMQRPTLRPIEVRQAKPRWMLDPTLVLYLPLWNLNGDVFLSQDAYGRTVTRYGATPTGQGGMSFDGVDDRLDCGNTSLVGSELTTCAWVKTNASVAGNGTIIGRDGEATRGWYFLVNANRLFAEIVTPGWTITGSTTLVVGVWYFAVFRWTGAEGGLYLNAISDVSPTAVTSCPEGSDVLGIGRSPPYAGFLPGTIGEVSAYNRALTEQEIRNLYNESRGRYGGG